MSEKSSGEVRFELDPSHPPRMTDEQIARLRAMQDEEIDCSDTPPLVRPPARRLYGPRFQAKTEDLVVLEPDVVEFFRSTGELSAERINAALRQYMEQQRKSAYVGAYEVNHGPGGANDRLLCAPRTVG